MPIVLASEWVEEEEATDLAPAEIVRGLELDAIVMASTESLFPCREPAGVVSPVDTGCDRVEKTDGESSPLVATDEMDEPEDVRETGFELVSSGEGMVDAMVDLDWRRADASA